MISCQIAEQGRIAGGTEYWAGPRRECEEGKGVRDCVCCPLPTASLEARGCNPHPQHDQPLHAKSTSSNGEDPACRESGKQKLRGAKVTTVSAPKTRTARRGSCLRLTRLPRGPEIPYCVHTQSPFPTAQEGWVAGSDLGGAVNVDGMMDGLECAGLQVSRSRVAARGQGKSAVNAKSKSKATRPDDQTRRPDQTTPRLVREQRRD